MAYLGKSLCIAAAADRECASGDEKGSYSDLLTNDGFHPVGNYWGMGFSAGESPTSPPFSVGTIENLKFLEICFCTRKCFNRQNIQLLL